MFKVIVARPEFQKLITLAKLATHKRNTVTGCVKLSTSLGALTINSGNAVDFAVQTVQRTVDVMSAGSVMVNAAELLNAVKAMAKGDDTLMMEESDGVLRIVGNGEVASVGITTGEFPAMAVADAPLGAPLVKLANLASVLASAIPAVSAESTRYALHGVNLRMNGKTESTGTDGRRIHHASTENVHDAAVEFSSIVPANCAEFIVKLAKSKLFPDAVVVVFEIEYPTSGKLLVVKCGEFSIQMTPVDGNFPPHKEYLGEHQGTTSIELLDRESTLALFARANKLGAAPGGRNGSALHIIPGKGIEVSDGGFKSSIPCRVTGNELTIGFNPSFLADALNSVRGECVKIEFDSALKPCHIFGDDSKAIIMPCNL